jgi:hypothetical protein
VRRSWRVRHCALPCSVSSGVVLEKVMSDPPVPSSSTCSAPGPCFIDAPRPIFSGGLLCEGFRRWGQQREQAGSQCDPMEGAMARLRLQVLYPVQLAAAARAQREGAGWGISSLERKSTAGPGKKPGAPCPSGLPNVAGGARSAIPTRPRHGTLLAN